jgi:origin recognition complex subunit 5
MSVQFTQLTKTQIPHLTTIFITTSPRPNFLHTPGVPHISFPAYTKPELLSVLSLTTPSPLLPKGLQETQDTWSRFCSAVWDSIAKHSSRSLLSFRDLCLTLWPKFIAPILSNQLSAQPFSKLLLANRALFQNDGVVVHNTVSTSTSTDTSKKGIGTELPYYSRLLLVASYLASFNRPQTDSVFFMKTSSSRRRKRGGGTALTKTSSKPGVTKHRKIARRLLGPQAFILERMLAIFHAIKADATGGKGRGRVEGSADIYSAIATLASLRLLVKLGPGNANDSLEGGARYRVAVGWEVVRGVARSVGVEVEDYLAE